MILPAKILLIFFLPLYLAFPTLHHGWANYDQTKTLDYTGLMEEITYENPDGMLQFQHEDNTCTVVLAPPSRVRPGEM